jgi:hypothetical protein
MNRAVAVIARRRSDHNAAAGCLTLYESTLAHLGFAVRMVVCSCGGFEERAFYFGFGPLKKKTPNKVNTEHGGEGSFCFVFVVVVRGRHAMLCALRAGHERRSR